MSSYEVKIQQFEGPMDLLLYLVQKNELHPKDISIAEITDQFLEYIRQIEETNLSLAGDFLFMASRLMMLKARELLPKEEQDEIEMIEFDAEKEALLEKILEYEKFKNIADDLKFNEEEVLMTFYRGKDENVKEDVNDDELPAEETVYHLYKSFLESVKIQSKENVHVIELDDVLIEDRQQSILNHLQIHNKALYEELLGNDHRIINRAVTFIAMLEMVKTDQIIVRQAETLGAIWIYRKKNNVENLDEIENDIQIFSEDPNIKEGLVNEIKETVKNRVEKHDIDAVLKEVSLRVSQGHKIDDRTLDAMLAGEKPPERNTERYRTKERIMNIKLIRLMRKNWKIDFEY